MKYYIKNNISNEYLIEHYGFEKIPHFEHYNLEVVNDMNYGLQVWWSDRSVRVILGDHAEYGIAPISEILFRMITDDVIEQKKDADSDEE